MQTLQDVASERSDLRGHFSATETPFVDDRLQELEEELSDEVPVAEAFVTPSSVTTPFLSNEWAEAGESEATAPEVAALAEITAELKDHAFRDALEELAEEALDRHAEQLATEYGDRETRNFAAERLLNQHFQPLAAQTEELVDRLFEQIQHYKPEALTDQEIHRILTEVLPPVQAISPASDHFLNSFRAKLGHLVSKGVDLAKRGVAGFAMQRLIPMLKKSAQSLLKQIVLYALNKLPVSLQPLAQKLSDRLFHGANISHEYEEQEFAESAVSGATVIPAAADVGRLEAEFDLHMAQLLLTPDENEADRLVSCYEDELQQGQESSLAVLDRARADLTDGLARLQPGESVEPVIEHFLPALQLAAKGAIIVKGRPWVVNLIGRILSKLISPLIGKDYSRLLAPAIADAGLHLLDLEAGANDYRAMANEALAATVEETLTNLSELPASAFEDETVLGAAVQEAFENAAASYFPDGVIRPELREAADHQGMWVHKTGSGATSYAKYSQTLPVTISQKTAEKIGTFGGNSLHDHLTDHGATRDGHPLKGNVSLYQAGLGTRGSAIARAEGFPVSQLHPLTPQAAGALLGPNAALGKKATPTPYLASPEKLHVGQRLYRIEHSRGVGRHRHVPKLRFNLLLNLQRGEIVLWLYLSEALCQKISTQLAQGDNHMSAFIPLKHLVTRTSEAFRLATVEHHLPPGILIVGETPNLEGKAPHWLAHAGHQLASKIAQWAHSELAEYLRNNIQEFRRLCSSHYDGLTLRLTMTNIPGIEILRQLSQGNVPKDISQTDWLKGTPSFAIVARAGHAINRLRH